MVRKETLKVEIYYCHGMGIFIDDELIEDAYGIDVIGEDRIRISCHKGYIDVSAEEVMYVWGEKVGVEKGELVVPIKRMYEWRLIKTQ